MYRHILIPTDGSNTAEKAVAAGLLLAKDCGARATVLSVEEPFASLGDRSHAFSSVPESLRTQALDYLHSQARSALARATGLARDIGADAPDTALVEADHVDREILAAAERLGADLIVMGSHGRRGISAMLLGSITQKVLTHSRLPVLVIR